MFTQGPAAPWSAAACLLACVALACFASGRAAAPAFALPRPPEALPLNERVLVVYNQSVPESLEVAD